MASFKKDVSKGRTVWRVQVWVGEVRESATFTTKAEAAAWAAQRETEIRQGGATRGKKHTLLEAFHRYEKEVSAHKRGMRWEIVRMNAIARHKVNGQDLGSMPLEAVTPEVLGAWRDSRMSGDKPVSGSTVNRDMNLLSHVFSTAQQEWKWIASTPTTNVRRPKEAAARDRRISDDEIDRLCFALGFDEQPVQTKSGAVAVAFLFAIETAMRAGEICSLAPGNVTGAVAHLPMTKNGRKRDVPLSKRARELLAYLPPSGDTVFGISSSTLDALFRKAKARAQIDGLTFHDSRHEAITRLARKLTVLELARMVGHTNLNQLQTYYNETAENLAARLD
ncbi:tyrosine-type recombinase/integrase [Pseudoduganella chitinolytica]|uniref:Site-specific integrase n=1 Tax=Pseudoduganella chitinolytica TaxID=34070 RepID=A0ABY8BFZ8_9BURK|nr:site-specific integrase [Pseudoduganella chitinolytica]WEF34847.1 site-specific integrase [Pseudoduganella chitinolytica]